MGCSSPTDDVDGVRLAGLTFRRSPTLVLHWVDGALLLQNYAVPCSVRAHPTIVELLDQFSTWKSLDAYLQTQPANLREYGGRLVAVLPRSEANLEVLGRYMTGAAEAA